MNTIVISCMYRRLSSFLDSEYNDADTIFLRNAGANVQTLLGSVKSVASANKIKEIIIAPHTDCGAMGLVYKALHGEATTSKIVNECLVSQFKDVGGYSRDEIERKANVKIQKAAIEQLASAMGANVRTELVDISKLDIPKHDGKHILTITCPSSSRYSQLLERYEDEEVGMYDSYFIQASEVHDVLADVEIAILALHIAEVRIVAEAHDQVARLEQGLKQIRSQQYSFGANFSLIK